MAVQQVNFKQEEQEENNNIAGFSDKIGKMLATARKERDLTTAQAAKILNIRAEHLIAFEKNDYSTMPTSYALGFLKSYATYLNLDANAIITELKNSGHLKTSVQHHIPQPIETNIVPSRTIIISTIIILSIILSGWAVYTLQQKKVTHIPEPQKTKAEHKPAITPKIQKIKKTEPIKKPIVIKPEIKQKVKQRVKVFTPIKIKAVKKEVPAVNKEITLMFTGTVWIQIRSIDNSKIYISKTFNEGDSYSFESSVDTVIDIGNSAAVKMLVNGVDHSPWDKNDGIVIKGVSTDIATIMQINKDLPR